MNGNQYLPELREVQRNSFKILQEISLTKDAHREKMDVAAVDHKQDLHLSVADADHGR